MREALQGVPEKRAADAGGLVTLRISPDTGMLASGENPDAILETFMTDHLPAGDEAGGEGPASTRTGRMPAEASRSSDVDRPIRASEPMTKQHPVRTENLRRALAQEAARVMAEHGIRDFLFAKRKAAERFGVTDNAVLPKNTEIEDALAEYQRLFGGDFARESALRAAPGGARSHAAAAGVRAAPGRVRC